MTKEEYGEGAKACDLEEGDTVRVTRIAEDGEFGWPNKWIRVMDASVNYTFLVVRNDRLLKGVVLKIGNKDCSFPWFVLKRVEVRTKNILLICEDYTEEIPVSDKLFDMINEKKTVKMSFTTFNE